MKNISMNMLFTTKILILVILVIRNVHTFRISSIASLRKRQIQMHVYSSDKGVPAALIEERDACGVGFIASLKNYASNDVISQAIQACNCMEHRGASSADNISGDGAGIMSSIPWDLLNMDNDVSQSMSKVLRNEDGTETKAVGMIFLPKDDDKRKEIVQMIEKVLNKFNFEIVKWREVPVNNSVLGELSRQFVPSIQQIIIKGTIKSVNKTQGDFDRLLYDARREIQGYFRKMQSPESYVCSLSSKTIVYKGMLRACDLSLFYTDLTNPLYKSAFAIYHRRFSTNTVPKWFLAQPMRMLAHNGEINTLLGNINWVKSRQYALREQLSLKSAPDRQVRGPLVDVKRSDSANLDSILDSYVKSGRSPEESIMMLVPEAYQSQPKYYANSVSEEDAMVSSFYKYFESMQESWDGPALLVFSDGNSVGASLDRNGLRPARYMIVTNDTSSAGKEFAHELVHVMSEVGVTRALQQFSDSEKTVQADWQLIESGRLGPGEMLSVNLNEGILRLNDEIKFNIASKRPYNLWIEKSIADLKRLPTFNRDIEIFTNNYQVNATPDDPVDSSPTRPVAIELDNPNLIQTQTFFGWGTEDVEVQISAMAADAIEATYCMGDDAPLACLSALPHTLYDYFKQRFAQVTNPPIDPLREGAVMSLSMFLGPRGDPIKSLNQPQSLKRIKIESPILNTAELESLFASQNNSNDDENGVVMRTISTLYDIKIGLTVNGIESVVERICDEAVRSVVAGATIIHLSDRKSDLFEDLSLDQPSVPDSKVTYQGLTYLPPLLAVAAVHHKLIEAGLRTKASIVVSTGSAWSTHHMALLIGYGASAIVPYTAYDAVLNWHGQKRNQLAMERGDLPKLSVDKALVNYRKALEKGILKILSKMGISLLTSYHGSQIFEAIGIADDVINKVFKGTPCRVSGLSFDDIALETIEFARKAYGDSQFENIIAKIESESPTSAPVSKLFNYGFFNYFKSGEYHHNNQVLIKSLHQAIRSHDVDLYNLYEESVKSRPPTTLRDTLEFVKDPATRPKITLVEVESVESIMTRFCTGGMSLGALSREAHETLAIALNRIGGKSNCGEGGEDSIRRQVINDVDDDEGISAAFPHLKGVRNGDTASSKIKQIASGRFGVTPSYLVSGDQLEIKIAQGAKPGEGGQLPGAKIDQYIATLRKSKPGVTLISPPPHHDIYSIEDLAQLIYDLHQINPEAFVSVKLVSEVGIGTVASGVTKAGADVIQVSGHDGGTGASPVSSIKHAGSPWELGLVETHATLLRNGLRDRVLLRVDGGLKSGWDVVMAAILGAEEFGFGTIAMIAEGCIMARICHTNKCPVGVTTQNEALRKRFPGTPDNVVTFFGYVAEEVRHILAELGFRSLDEVIGRVDLIRPRELSLKKASQLDGFQFISDFNSDIDLNDRKWLHHGPAFSNGFTFDDKLLQDDKLLYAITNQGTFSGNYHIKNTDRSSFARISGKLAKLYGDYGFNGRLTFYLTGASGQSFAAFLSQGMEVTLTGYANDYVCKGIAGGKVTIKPPEALVGQINSKRQSRSPSVVGNTCLYGATGGHVYINGRGGERFAVRNSGAVAVIEGFGDHGCEYMTGGVVVSLGSTGKNFAAGMTGGVSFILPDEDWLDSIPSTPTKLQFPDYVNKESVTLVTLTHEYKAAINFVRNILENHLSETGSSRAQTVLNNFSRAVEKIWMIYPASEKSNALVQKDVSNSLDISTSASV